MEISSLGSVKQGLWIGNAKLSENGDLLVLHMWTEELLQSSYTPGTTSVGKERHSLGDQTSPRAGI